MKKQPKMNEKKQSQNQKGYNQFKKPLPQPKDYEEIEY